MEICKLESFVAVVEEGSIAGASRRLELTAGAVAQRIRKLEQDLGLRLLIRSGRSVRPTDVGGCRPEPDAGCRAGRRRTPANADGTRVRRRVADRGGPERRLRPDARFNGLPCGEIPRERSRPGQQGLGAALCPVSWSGTGCGDPAQTVAASAEELQVGRLYGTRLVLLAPAAATDSTPEVLL